MEEPMKEEVTKVTKEKSKGRIEAGKRLAKLNKERRERIVVHKNRGWFDDNWFNAGVVAGVVVVGGCYYYYNSKSAKESQPQITYTRPEVIEEPIQTEPQSVSGLDHDPFSMK